MLIRPGKLQPRRRAMTATAELTARPKLTVRPRARPGAARLITAWDAQALAYRAQPPLAAAAENAPAAWIFAALLDARGTGHGGAATGLVRRGMRTVRTMVDHFLAGNATRLRVFGGSLKVHVIHEAIGPTQQWYRGVLLHRLHNWTGARAGDDGPPIPAQDARWDAIKHIIDSGVATPPDDACVFSIDLLDVRVINDVRRLCTAHPAASTLFASTDMCAEGAAQRFMRWQVSLTNWTASPKLEEVLATPRHQRPPDCMRLACRVPNVPHNVGIFGGQFGGAHSGHAWRGRARAICGRRERGVQPGGAVRRADGWRREWPGFTSHGGGGRR